MLNHRYFTIPIVLVGVAFLVTAWVHRNGLIQTHMYEWHGVLMMIGFVGVLTEALIAFRVNHDSPKSYVHFYFNTIATLITLLGFVLVIIFQNSANHFKSTHSIIGLISFILYFIQYVIGLMVFRFGWFQSVFHMPLFRKFHYYSGLLVFFLIYLTLSYGAARYNEILANFGDKEWSFYRVFCYVLLVLFIFVYAIIQYFLSSPRTSTSHSEKKNGSNSGSGSNGSNESNPLLA